MLTTKEIYEIRLEEATGNYVVSILEHNKFAAKSWLKIIKDCDNVLANVGEQ